MLKMELTLETEYVTRLGTTIHRVHCDKTPRANLDLSFSKLLDST